MATVLALPRSLSAVLLDVQTSKARLTALDARIMGRDPDADEQRLWDELETRISSGEAEARGLVLSATGVSWDELYQVLA